MEPETTEIAAVRRTDSAEDLTPFAYRDKATQLVLGENWSYDDLADMTSWRESVDRVALALVEERRAGLIRPHGD